MIDYYKYIIIYNVYVFKWYYKIIQNKYNDCLVVFPDNDSLWKVVSDDPIDL
jgi:hypothetical protein